MMKNKLIIVLAMFILPLSVLAVDDGLIPIEEPVYVEQTTDSSADLHTQDIDDIQGVIPKPDEQQSLKNENNTLPHKQPISKRELLKKFLLAMFLVGLTPFVIYLGNFLYKKIRTDVPPQVKTPEGKTPLSVPEDLESAAKIFLEKTKWV